MISLKYGAKSAVEILMVGDTGWYFIDNINESYHQDWKKFETNGLELFEQNQNLIQTDINVSSTKTSSY